ncbi:porin family protein [Fodinibius halophilus]|uniref:PorT family protein n=1 Tax=Fodinibius halophilus TaxID=1736908 RepID=A0A6M1T1Y1_9BACT|nr:porin family protein [Fodinibius halophilus]NGP87215.1 PorT family protein [Fodinibius halophilus]
MKKLLIPLLLFATITIFSVNKAKAQAEIGIRAGVNYSNLNDQPDNLDPSNRTGLMLGGYLNLKVPMSPISIQPEVLYTQKGYKALGGTLKLDYIEVPVLAKFSFAPGPVQPHVYFGPYAGFVFNSEVSGGSLSIDLDNTKTDFGGVVGAGTDLNVGAAKLNIGVRYNFGLTSNLDIEDAGKNSVLSIVGGFSF